MSYTNWTTQPQRTTGTITVTPVNVAYNNSNWYELSSGISRPVLFVGLVVTNVVVVEYRVDVGIGAAASEVVAGTITNRVEGSDSGAGFCEFKPPFYIAANTRISVRLRKSGTSIADWFIGGVYYYIDPYGVADFSATADFTAVATVVHSVPHTAPSFSARTIQIRDPRRF